MKKNEPGRFCIVPFVQLNTRGQGNLRVCCTITGLPYGIPRTGTIDEVNAKKSPATRETFDLRVDPISEVWNSEFMRDFRMKMINGEYVSNCEKCFYLEDRGINSKRVNRNLLFGESHAHVVAEAQATGGKISTLPAWWEIRFSTKCNLSCRMCTASLSTKRLSELQAHPEHLNAELKGELEMAQRLLVGGHLGDSALFRQQIDEVMKDARYLEMRGGEVFADPEAVGFLAKLALETKHAQQIRLDLTTNLTTLTDHHLDILNGFKRGTIKCSIDGFAEENDYIRYPSKWSVIVKNLSRLKHLHKGWTKVIQPTISVYQICTLHRLFWFLDEFVKSNGLELSLSLTSVRDTPHLDPHLLPLAVRQKAVPEVNKFLSRSYLCNHSPHREMNRKMLCGLLRSLEDPRLATESERREFVSYTQALDQIRGQSTLAVFPQLAAIFEGTPLRVFSETQKTN
ncbi:MAG: SPASM domain-containing protein [Bdellovibrionales bacterium]|nr:SPASM domain-containing protein [Bdellovibrionales bacterium]